MTILARRPLLRARYVRFVKDLRGRRVNPARFGGLPPGSGPRRRGYCTGPGRNAGRLVLRFPFGKASDPRPDIELDCSGDKMQ